MAVDPGSDEWTEGVRTILVPLKQRGIGIGTNRQALQHTIISVQVGSAAARNGNFLVGEFVTYIDSLLTNTMIHAELHRALQGPEYTSVSNPHS